MEPISILSLKFSIQVKLIFIPLNSASITNLMFYLHLNLLHGIDNLKQLERGMRVGGY